MAYYKLTVLPFSSHPNPPTASGEIGGAYNFTTLGVDGGILTQATLQGLRPYSSYSIVLQAFNSRGAGPLSPPTIGVTLEDSKWAFSMFSEEYMYLEIGEKDFEVLKID